jgi:hypothetical protein
MSHQSRSLYHNNTASQNHRHHSHASQLTDTMHVAQHAHALAPVALQPSQPHNKRRHVLTGILQNSSASMRAWVVQPVQCGGRGLAGGHRRRMSRCSSTSPLLLTALYTVLHLDHLDRGEECWPTGQAATKSLMVTMSSESPPRQAPSECVGSE